jgi:uncharacterized membrane protein
MSGQILGLEYYIAKNRLETLIDGIFAIAMTLLVLGIGPPKPPEALAPAVLPGMIFDLVPQVFVFIVAFLVLAYFWLGHHRQFYFVSMVDPALLWINILLLISIVFIPFSTDLVGDYPNVISAVLLFHANILIVGLLFAHQWDHIRRHECLCDPVPEARIIRLWHLQAAFVPAIALAAIMISFISPVISLLVYLILPVGALALRRSFRL